MKRFWQPLAAMTIAAAVLGSQAALAQGRFPDRPIRIVVGSLAGGTTDVAARKLAALLGPVLGQSVVIENKAGAGGLIAGVEVSKAAPDGHTLQMGSTSTTTIAPLMQSPPPFNLRTDFVPINVIGGVPLALFVNPGVEAKSLSELISLIRKSPGKFSYASAGVGTTSNLTGELLKIMAGNLDMLHVPYKGGPAMDQAVVTGEVQLSFDSPSAVMELHRGGKVRILAVLSEKRSDLSPDFPTAIEQGMPNLVAEVSFYLLAPARTPRPVVDALFAATNKVVASDEYRKDMIKSMLQPLSSASQEAANQYVRSELDRWQNVIEKHGAKTN